MKYTSTSMVSSEHERESGDETSVELNFRPRQQRHERCTLKKVGGLLSLHAAAVGLSIHPRA